MCKYAINKKNEKVSAKTINENDQNTKGITYKCLDSLCNIPLVHVRESTNNRSYFRHEIVSTCKYSSNKSKSIKSKKSKDVDDDLTFITRWKTTCTQNPNNIIDPSNYTTVLSEHHKKYTIIHNLLTDDAIKNIQNENVENLILSNTPRYLKIYEINNRYYTKFTKKTEEITAFNNSNMNIYIDIYGNKIVHFQRCPKTNNLKLSEFGYGYEINVLDKEQFIYNHFNVYIGYATIKTKIYGLLDYCIEYHPTHQKQYNNDSDDDYDDDYQEKQNYVYTYIVDLPPNDIDLVMKLLNTKNSIDTFNIIKLFTNNAIYYGMMLYLKYHGIQDDVNLITILNWRYSDTKNNINILENDLQHDFNDAKYGQYTIFKTLITQKNDNNIIKSISHKYSIIPLNGEITIEWLYDLFICWYLLTLMHNYLFDDNVFMQYINQYQNMRKSFDKNKLMELINYKTENIYLFVSMVFFDDLDKVYLNSYDSDRNSYVRMSACMKKSLKDKNNKKHKESYYLNGDFVKQEFIRYNMDIDKATIIYDKIKMYELPNCKPTNMYLSSKYCKYEMAIKKYVKQILEFPTSDIEEYTSIRDNLKNGESDFNAQQQNAINNSIVNPFSIITGYPGTGKSDVIVQLIKYHCDINKKVRVMSFTATAASVIKDRISKYVELGTMIYKNELMNDCEEFMKRSNLQITTIDSFIKSYDNPNKKEDLNLVIIDEFSMVGIEKFYEVIQILGKKKIKLIVVGDDSQLPCINHGNLLSDFINYGRTNTQIINTNGKECKINVIDNTKQHIIPLVHLTTVVRTGAEPLLNLFADIRNNNFDNMMTNNANYTYIDDTSLTCETLINSLSLSKNKSVYNTLILTHTNKGICGANNLNKYIRKNIMKFEDEDFVIGDKIICTLNGIYNNHYINNGAIFYITDIDAKSNYTLSDVQFGTTNLITISVDDIKVFKFAYVMTIHKSQGKESEHVIVILANQFLHMYNKNLLYTAMTRTKNTCTVIAKPKILKHCFDRIVPNLLTYIPCMDKEHVIYEHVHSNNVIVNESFYNLIHEHN